MITLAGALMGVLLGFITVAAAQPTPVATDDLAFFESKIRPLLIENCYDCHSVGAKRIRGGFLLDSSPGLLRGGDSGPAIIPGQADASRLVNMVRHHPDFESMPPKSKLSPAQIQDLISWIDRGAPDPRLKEPETNALASDFDLEARKKWWSLHPLADPAPPAVDDPSWPANDYDHFILAALEAKGWQPAEPADRRTLLRRLSFDLIGLAPTPAEMDAFLRDQSPRAYATQVDRLLASPHFGEKWARHWMDLVRYAETKAFEADYTMPFAYQYRDYLTRAFNADVPFDHFTLEALAGDLLPKPRIDPVTGENESLKGPGFLFLSDGQHGPPDLHEDEARIFATVIDVTTKTFLGSTVACARCHDHKFDAITTADYYSLYGILNSSRLSYTNTVIESAYGENLTKIEAAQQQLEPLIFAALESEFARAADYLDARDRVLANTTLSADFAELRDTFPPELGAKDATKLRGQLSALLEPFCTATAGENLDPKILQNWVRLALLPDEQERWPELAPLFADRTPTPPPDSTAPPESSPAFTSLLPSVAEWPRQGSAFTTSSIDATELVIAADGSEIVQTVLGPQAIATHPANRLSGVIRSPDFILDGQPIRLQAKGQFATIRLVIRNYELTGRGPTTAGLSVPVSGNHWQNITFATSLWPGQPAYLEIVQHGQLTRALQPRESVADFDENAYLAIRFENTRIAPPDVGHGVGFDPHRPLATRSKPAARRLRN
ncbi:DUF1549 domain-containing protein [Parvibaculum sp.]|uniref:DUF1549 domain-containing protein n=1 Tax=Parvibaculum sp. TaxID=2024848 RepID=UPI003BAACCFD